MVTIPPTLFEGKTVTPKNRLEHLLRIHDQLSKRTDQKMERGCLHVPRKVGHIKGSVLAQTLGIISHEASDEVRHRAFRWLFAHTNGSADRFDVRKPQNQWQAIVEKMFLGDHGKYAELAVLERILLSVLKPKGTGVSIRDIFFADTMADRVCMTDWIAHQQLVHEVLHWGIQLGIGGFITKQNDLSKRHIHDRGLFGRKAPQVVEDFLRHTTMVLSLPSFETEGAFRRNAFQHILAGSTRYQSEHIMGNGNKNFANIGQSFLSAMEFFQTGVRDRFIDSHYRLDHHTFGYTDPKTGENISCKIWLNKGTPTFDLRMTMAPYFKQKLHSADRPRIIKETILKMSITIPSEFLDIMRDMMGVRAI